MDSSNSMLPFELISKSVPCEELPSINDKSERPELVMPLIVRIRLFGELFPVLLRRVALTDEDLAAMEEEFDLLFRTLTDRVRLLELLEESVPSLRLLVRPRPFNDLLDDDLPDKDLLDFDFELFVLLLLLVLITEAPLDDCRLTDFFSELSSSETSAVFSVKLSIW